MKVLLLILKIGLTISTIQNSKNCEIQKTLDNLQDLINTELSLIERFSGYLNGLKNRFTTLSNVESGLKELTEVSNSVKEHFSSANKTSHVLKQLSTLWKQIDDIKNITLLEDVYKSNSSVLFDDFSAMLCNNEIALSPALKKNLKCRYTDNRNLFLKIAPFKQEDIYPAPHIITLYHNVINNEEMAILQELSYPLFETSSVGDMDQNDVYDESILRVSKNSWLIEEDHKFVETINRRIEHITNLDVKMAEDLQIAYYQKAGYFGKHHDFHPSKEAPFDNEFARNRIATLMFYLNDVEKGGNTIFPLLNVSLSPEKGSAVFWYNILPNGELDYNTLHAGCPVTSGTKWVANKWLRETGQEFRRPCTLNNFKWSDDNAILTIE